MHTSSTTFQEVLRFDFWGLPLNLKCAQEKCCPTTPLQKIYCETVISMRPKEKAQPISSHLKIIQHPIFLTQRNLEPLNLQRKPNKFNCRGCSSCVQRLGLKRKATKQIMALAHINLYNILFFNHKGTQTHFICQGYQTSSFPKD